MIKNTEMGTRCENWKRKRPPADHREKWRESEKTSR